MRNETDIDKKTKENNFKTDQDTKLPFVNRESINQNTRTKLNLCSLIVRLMTSVLN